MFPWGQNCSFRVLITGLITCERLTLKCWKDPKTPTLKMWREQMMGTVACEKLLGRLNLQNVMVKGQWDSFSG